MYIYYTCIHIYTYIYIYIYIYIKYIVLYFNILVFFPIKTCNAKNIFHKYINIANIATTEVVLDWPPNFRYLPEKYWSWKMLFPSLIRS